MIVECDFAFHRKNFSLKFVKNFSSNAVVALTGESGSGKTTLLRLMLGLEYSKNATFIVDGEIYQKNDIFLKAEQRQIGYIGQNSMLFPFMTIKSNLLFAQKRANNNYLTPSINQLLDFFGVLSCIDKLPSQLSLGKKQRICIAQMILSTPKLFLFDEAFSAIDEKRKIKIFEFLFTFFDKHSLPTIFVTHDQNELKNLKDCYNAIHIDISNQK